MKVRHSKHVFLWIEEDTSGEELQKLSNLKSQEFDPLLNSKIATAIGMGIMNCQFFSVILVVEN